MLRRTERALWIAGLVLLSCALSHLAQFAAFQHSRTLLPAAYRVPLQTPRAATAVNVAGRLDVSRIGLSVLVVDGSEDAGLKVGAVHLADTAVIGSAGNAVIIGHRDTAFWPLRRIRVGDRIRFSDVNSSMSFVVDSVRIVKRDDTSPLAYTNRRVVTLITCYPFRFIGGAPLRFIVRASLRSQTCTR